MFGTVKYSLLCKTVLLLFIKSCACEPQTPYLALYALGDAEYADVVVRRERDNVTLVCEVRGDATPRVFVWNYVGAGSAGGNETGDGDSGIPQSLPLPSGSGAAQRSTLERRALRVADSGHYMCSSPPFSVTKYLLVQTKGPPHCARGAFWCGVRCVLPGFVCDGRADCLRAEDEAPGLCGVQPCARSDRLNCSSGRCIPEAACCRPPGAVSLCAQHDCCGEHPRYSTLQGYVEVEYPPLFEDRHSPDDYGFIQSTIYTVTACALIFMVAVVLLVSALCKMHMKRAALRGYRATASHYESRFPPRYEATRLLDSGVPPSPIRSPQGVCPGSPGAEPPTGMEPPPAGLARLSAIFCSRYRQVPTQCCDVEMTDVRSASLNSSPSRPRPHMAEYRSPALTDLYYTDPDLTACGRDLNYMATPIDLFRRSYRRNTLDQRPLTLQLGRFQLSIPRFGRRSEDPRPDTPNVAEINIDDLDFVRLNSNETYTLNGRTIRLLGANFENYPVVDGSRPPPYNEAMRFKTYGPPPEYLSREAINTPNTDCNENEARTNVEMPPCYEDLASGVDTNANIENLAVNVIDLTDTGTGNVNNNVIDNDNDLFVETTIVSNDNGNCNVNDNDTVQIPESISSVIDNLPAIDSDVNANDAYNDTGVTVND